ncbi:L-ascorbate oxidase homolog [Silene latifolia]|uniref:L-ascorbate oxidase homolog n=1 Tax=Silene latifolia TaxID=37657 RepID=UPI003D76D382
MGETQYLAFLVGILALSTLVGLNAESPYRYYDLEITYGTVSPLGVSQRAILVNGQLPGPTMDCETNDNIIVNVINKLDEPFLMTWNGMWQRRMSWQDGVLGTNCPIPPHSNWTYRMQAKDQIGTYSYYPSTSLHRTGGGFGGFNIHRRPVIPSPYPEPAQQFTLTVGDWYKTDFKLLRKKLDLGQAMPIPDGILINGHPKNTVFTGEAGKTYMFRVANVGTMLSVNVRIQGHMLKLVEVEGSHVLQEMYESLDVHPGQSMSFLVTLHGMVKDYHIVASARFTKKHLVGRAILHYTGSTTPPADPLPVGPTYQIHWSMKQARTLRWNLTANAARPNPQGSYHYGGIQITRTLILANSAGKINGKKRYAVNQVSYVNPDTPLKLADYYNIPDVFNLNTIKDVPTPGKRLEYGTSVVGLALHDFVEIVFQNKEKTLQSWHLDGHNFFVVAYGAKKWTPAMRKKYNLVDSVWRTTVQVYPNSWTVVLAAVDNKGMWNLRSEIWHRRYLGQELYFRVWNDEKSLLSEADIPPNALKCGKAAKY